MWRLVSGTLITARRKRVLPFRGITTSDEPSNGRGHHKNCRNGKLGGFGIRYTGLQSDGGRMGWDGMGRIVNNQRCPSFPSLVHYLVKLAACIFSADSAFVRFDVSKFQDK